MTEPWMYEEPPPPELRLRGRKLIARDGSIVAEIFGFRLSLAGSGGYGYALASGERSPRNFAYFDDCVRAARAALAKAGK